MTSKIKKILEHPLSICLQIALVVALTDFFFMNLFDALGLEFSKELENIYDPLTMGIASVPLVYYSIVRPVLKRERSALDKNFHILSLQAKNLENAIRIATQELQDSQTRYELAVQGANDGIWEWRHKQEEVYLSPRWKMILGYEDNEFPDTKESWLSHTHPDDVENLRNVFCSLCPENPYVHFSYRMKNAQDETVWVLTKGMALFDHEGELLRVAGSQTDITEQKKNEENLYNNAYYDKLTGIPNRRLFQDRLNQIMLMAQRHPDPGFAILFLDMDNFKKINDSFGHNAGDLFLKHITHQLVSVLRQSDNVARLGGDEFAIIVQNVKNIKDVQRVANKIKGAIVKPFFLKKNKIYPSASIGIVFWDKTYHNIEDLLRDADFALYRAKEAGKNQYAVFDETMRQQAKTLFQKESELHQALEKDQLHVFYQPIVDTLSLEIKGFEALLRWEHPTFGWVSPVEFIRIAEDSDLILTLGDFVLEKSLEHFCSWQKQYPSLDFISVNVSARQLEDKKFIHRVKEALQNYQCMTRNLKLEVTESAVMRNPDRAKVALKALSHLGVKISIDDFGTGYSSLSMLHLFHFDELKIDKLFIQDIERNTQSQNLVASIEMMSKKMGIKTTAEGVETAQELKKLQEIGCDFIQGFYFYSPLPCQDIDAILKKSFLRKKRA